MVFENVLTLEFFKLRSPCLFATVSYDVFGEMFVLPEAVMFSVTSKFLADV